MKDAPAVRGRFLSIEGIDGAGKSTHIPMIAAQLQAAGIELVVTREPGGTPLAETWRAQLLNESMDGATECLLAFAARADHLDRVIRPALARGAWVLCDRFTDSSIAYQGAGRGLGVARVQALEAWLHPELQPDRTWLFDVPAELAESRRSAVRAADRFEQQDLAFFERVRAAYLQRARQDPQRFRVIDAARPPEAVAQAVMIDLRALIDAAPTRPGRTDAR